MSNAADTQRIGHAVGYPGIDPREFVFRAIVNAVRVDPANGVFCDVTLLPSGLQEVASVLPVYGGPNFGAYLPLEPDDEVIVLSPNGHPDAGLVVIHRGWDASTPPPAEIADHPTDLLILAKTGATVRIAVQGAGNVVLDPRGSGQVMLGGESGLSPTARLGDTVDTSILALVVALSPFFLPQPLPPPPIGSVSGTISSGSNKVLTK